MAREPKGMARVTRHQRPHVGAVGLSGTGNAGLRTGISAAAVTLGRPTPGDTQPDQSDPDRHGDGQPEPAGPVRERSGPNEEAGGHELPEDVLEGQLAGDPAAGEAEDGEGLPTDGAVGERDGDGSDERHGQKGVRHTTIFARPGRSPQVHPGRRGPAPFALAWGRREVMHVTTMTKESR